MTYRFAAEHPNTTLLLHVRMEFQLPASGVETLVLPTEWAGEKLDVIRNLSPKTPDTTITEGAVPAEKIVHGLAGHHVLLTYDLRKDWTGPLISPIQFHPAILPAYFEFTGSNGLVELKRSPDTRISANFDWQNLPAPWTLATSFGTAPANSTAPNKQRCQTYTGRQDDMDGALFAGGDFRLHPFKIGRRHAVLAVRDTWTFTDDEAAAQIGSAVGMVRNFWHDDSFPYFLVTLAPYDQDHDSSDGSAFTNAFWMFVSRKDKLTGLLPQLAHESFHAWNPGKMGTLSSKEDERTKWFKEGFTEYYAQRLSLANGIVSPEKYIASLNKDLMSFPSSTSEYIRGRVIALWLDAAIRQESHGAHSLDDLMFQMVRDNKQPLTEQRLFDTAGRYLPANSIELLRQAADQSGDLPAPAQIPALGDCVHASRNEFPSFDLGFDFNASRSAHKITGIEPNGPAYLAGLRDGQPWTHASFYGGDASRMAVIDITVDGKEKQISFYPRGKSFAAWQYAEQPGVACAATTQRH